MANKRAAKPGAPAPTDPEDAGSEISPDASSELVTTTSSNEPTSHDSVQNLEKPSESTFQKSTTGAASAHVRNEGDIARQELEARFLPERFSGHRKDAKSFIQALERYFRFRKAINEEDQASWGIQLLHPAGLTWWEGLPQKVQDETSQSFSSFKEKFLKAFGDPHLERHAAFELFQLRQRPGDVVGYVDEFLRLRRSIQAENLLLNLFLYGLCPEPRNELDRRALNQTVDDAVEATLSIVPSVASYRPTAVDRRRTHVSNGHGDEESGRHKHAVASTSGPARLSDEEKQRRRTMNLCFVCGSADHLRTDCPIRSKASDRSTATSRKNGSKNSVNNLSYDTTDAGSHVVSVKLLVTGSGGGDITTTALVDSGSVGSFVDASLVAKEGVPVCAKPVPLHLTVADGRTLRNGPVEQETIPLELQIQNHREKISFGVVSSLSHPIILGSDWLRRHDPVISWSENRVSFNSPFCQASCLGGSEVDPEQTQGEQERQVEQQITSINASGSIVESSPGPEVPAKYEEFVSVFSKEKADILPENRRYDMAIDLMPGERSPPFGPIYKLSEPELKALRQYIDENLSKNFIRPSKSPAGAPLLFVKKKDGSLRPCIDYRALNRITVKNRYPLPLIPELIDRLREAKVFTKIDLRGAYNLVRIKPGDEWKTAFRTRYGHYEYLVMPFGLTNAPSVFQNLMNDVMREFLDIFVIVYLDDILVYSRTMEEHTEHVRQVLQKLKENRLYAKLEKCEFDCTMVDFVGFTISPDGIFMKEDKVKTILDWKPPKTVRQLQSFLGFANYYRRFIRDYSTIATPLTRLTKKSIPYYWDTEANAAFEKLKLAFTQAPVLRHPNPKAAYVVEADASNVGVGAVLSQLGPDNALHPVAYFSRKLIPAEANYPIYDKELLAIRAAFEEWRHFLLGSAFPVQVCTDHRNLEYFKTSRKLNARQARWAQFFADFDFVIQYQPARKQHKADALSRQPDFETAAEVPEGPLLKPENFRIFGELSSMQAVDPIGNLVDRIRHATATDEYGQSLIKGLQTTPLENVAYTDGLLYKRGRLYVPEGQCRLDVMTIFHDSPSAGHFGVQKTVDLIKRSYWWPKLTPYVTEYIKSCETCARSKAPNHSQYGFLHSLPIPEGPWVSISMDFIVDLPPSDHHTAILVVVDRFTKMAHFIPCAKAVSASKTVSLFMDHIFRLHGLPKEIVSDRGPQFVSRFWKHLFTACGTKISLSSAYHPQSDGQTERVNQILEQYLRCFVDYDQRNWSHLLAHAEFAYNNARHSSTKVSPFYANYGFHPRLDLTPTSSPSVPAAEDLATFLNVLHKQLRVNISHAVTRHKHAADRHRTEPPTFQIGDKVWLSRAHIKTTRPCDKFDFKRLGPFQIIGKINDVAYRLQLPPSMKIHNVFHVSLLEPVTANSLSNRKQPPPPPIYVDGDKRYIVRNILDSRRRYNKLEYLVDWEGYDIQDRSWEPASNLSMIPDMVKSFHVRSPDKPGPTRRGRPVSTR